VVPEAICGNTFQISNPRITFPLDFLFPRGLHITYIVHPSLFILGIGVCVRVPPIDFVRFQQDHPWLVGMVGIRQWHSPSCWHTVQSALKAVERLFLRDLSDLSLPQIEVELKKRKMFDELIERRHGTSINPPKPMKDEPDTKEPDDADGYQAADVTSTGRRQRNVPIRAM
jgi:hypothetical protein